MLLKRREVCTCNKDYLVFIDIKKFYIDNIINLDYVTDIDIESDIYLMFLTLPAYAIILALFITSIIALVKGPAIIRKDNIEPNLDLN